MAKKTNQTTGKAQFKEGCFIRPFGSGSLINNDNLTDAIAIFWLEKHPEDAELFEVLPTIKTQE